jgi:transposase
MVENPDEIIVHKVTACKECGASLEEEPVIGVERRQIHEVPPLKIVVTEHRSEHKKFPIASVITVPSFLPMCNIRYNTVVT